MYYSVNGQNSYSPKCIGFNQMINEISLTILTQKHVTISSWQDSQAIYHRQQEMYWFNSH